MKVSFNGSRLQGRNAAIAAIVSGDDGRHVGMGIVIDPRRVLTCAHVINDALGQGLASRGKPASLVRVVFPLAPVHSERIARVSGWLPVEHGSRPGDLAVLELEESEPEIDGCIGYGSFAVVTGRTIDDDRLSVYGIVAGERIGHHVQAHFVGYASSAMIQVDSANDAGQLIRPGFSGACIFDVREQAIVGMVQRVKIDEVVVDDFATQEPPKISTAALALSTAQLAALIPGLGVEERGRPAWFFATWSLGTMLLLISCVSHLWVSQGGTGVIAQLAFESEHPSIAAFYGMHVIALIGPCVAWMLWRYSSDFNMSHWSRRIPPFPFFRESWQPGHRTAMSVMVILLFVVVPIYSQGHFLRKFNSDGYVFANVKTFGDDSWNGIGHRQCVLKDEFCTHPKVSRYSLMKGKFNLVSHFDYAYVYGEYRANTKTVALTFFPLWQPLAVLALSLIGLVILGRWIISLWSATVIIN
ncbi:MAG TPA: serine protease [Nitrosospira sp.]|nr:serine protease [Nitrosospira sp.]